MARQGSQTVEVGGRFPQESGQAADTEDVEQVSLPMRFALLAVLAFAGLWFVALRPKPPAAPPATPAPATASGVTSAPKKAEGAVAKANAKASGKTAGSADADAATPAAEATPAAAAPGAEATKAAAEAEPAGSQPAGTGAPTPGAAKQSPALKRVLGDLDDKRTVVLLFWDGKTAEDREVRRAVGGADRHDGRVKVHVQRISKLGDFEPITRGVPVVKSPTVLVIGRDRKARSVAGLTVRSEVDELVDRAIAGR